MYKSSLHHSFDVALATELGDINLAILIHHFQFWIMLNKRQGINFKEGCTWTYQTVKQITAAFPYWSKKQVERLLNKAVELGILKKGNFNKNSFDQTAWYAFVDEESFGVENFEEMDGDVDLAKSPNGEREIDFPKSGNGNPEIGNTIPDTNKDSEYKEKREKEKKAEATSSKADSLSPSFSAPAKKTNFEKERQPNVHVADEDHKRLVAQIGEEMTLACYKKLSEWKEDSPRSKWKRNDYRSITNWVVNAVIEDKDREKARSAHFSKEKPSDIENHIKPEIVENRRLSERIRGIVEAYEIPLKKNMLVTTNSVSITDRTKDIDQTWVFDCNPEHFRTAIVNTALTVFPRAEQELKKFRR